MLTNGVVRILFVIMLLLTTGWSVVTAITLVLTAFAVIRLLKPTRGYRP